MDVRLLFMAVPAKCRCCSLLWMWVNSSSNNAREVSTHGHHQMVDTEIRLIIFLLPKMEKLYTVSKNKTGS